LKVLLNWIRTFGWLSVAKSDGLIPELKSLFKGLIQNKHCYSIDILNQILETGHENKLLE